MHRSLAAIFGTILTLSGCGGGTIYYAEGVDLATRDADFGACDAQALVDFPIRNETRYTPRVYHPTVETCDATGACSTVEGYWEGGTAYTVDANLSSRMTAARACMGTRGYARVGLPNCEPDTAVRISTVMPTLTDGTCLLQRGPGGPLVVNPTEE